MGCLNTKLVPEGAPSHVDVVKTVYDTDLKRGQHEHQQNNKEQQNSRSRNYESSTAGQRTSKKVAKYRAKFDPRVTAKYDIKALIGRGSFSRVVRVEHRITKQPYAIKMVDRLQGREVCESELHVLRRVRHMYIIQLIEVFESKDKLYMVMELATGGELFDRIIAKGNFTERDATRVLKMVLEGVQYLHSLGITHRDLKPEKPAVLPPRT